MEKEKSQSLAPTAPDSIPEKDVTRITSDMVNNASASGDGSIKRSEEAIEGKSGDAGEQPSKSY